MGAAMACRAILVFAANPANPANGCRRIGRLSLVAASPYATPRVTSRPVAYWASFAGLRCASKLAPRSPSRSLGYGSIHWPKCLKGKESDGLASSDEKDQSPTE
jgi:hypothetical protein